jgi:hypothetical protein
MKAHKATNHIAGKLKKTVVEFESDTVSLAVTSAVKLWLLSELTCCNLNILLNNI